MGLLKQFGTGYRTSRNITTQIVSNGIRISRNPATVVVPKDILNEVLNEIPNEILNDRRPSYWIGPEEDRKWPPSIPNSIPNGITRVSRDWAHWVLLHDIRSTSRGGWPKPKKDIVRMKQKTNWIPGQTLAISFTTPIDDFTATSPL